MHGVRTLVMVRHAGISFLTTGNYRRTEFRKNGKPLGDFFSFYARRRHLKTFIEYEPPFRITVFSDAFRSLNSTLPIQWRNENIHRSAK